MSDGGSAVDPADVWAGVVGQPEAVARLKASAAQPVHAYMFVGPPGSGRRAALRAFAAELLSAGVEDPDEAERHRRLALAEHHPDLVVVEPQGGVFRGDLDKEDSEAGQVLREAFRSPVEAERKVVAALDFHTANDKAIGTLLKTIEEPPERTVVVIVADHIAEGQVTIDSRCMRVDFNPLGPDVLADVLAAEGVPPDRAAEVVALAGGDVNRARVLATDERLHLRVTAWREVPVRLEEAGAAVARVVDDLRAMIDDAMAPLAEQHEADLARFDDEVERYGQRGTAGRRSELVRRQKRVERKFRTDELRLGLANLAGVYRDEAAVAADPSAALASLAAIHDAVEALVVNPNEELLLLALFLHLAPLPR